VQTVATIGVDGFAVEVLLDRRREADVGTLLDVGQRRGVRGADGWASSARLQAAPAQADIADHHRDELAPTTELRRLPYREDAGRFARLGCAMIPRRHPRTS
jgi:hypothetical protein